MPIEIAALKQAAEVLHEVAHAVNRASPDDPTPEAMTVVAHAMSAHEILAHLTRHIQLNASADAVQQLLIDLARDRLRLAVPDLRHDIRGEIGGALVAARLLGRAQTDGDLAYFQNVIVYALEQMQAKLDDSTGSRLN